MSIVTRFAPSPTGYLHLGHAYAAWVAWAKAAAAGGRFLVRLEDIDRTRCKPEFAAAALEDLRWLGFDWDGDVRVQSAHLPVYESALEGLAARGLVYPCFCSRAGITRARSAPYDAARSAPHDAAQAAPHGSEDVYPGTCRRMSKAERAERVAAGQSYARRLDVARATREAGPLRFFEETAGWRFARPERFGDVVLGRRDIATSYHLCVVCDDAAQGVSHVTRAEDLAAVTDIHVLLQNLLGLVTPVYAHHRLLTDDTGRRFAKRDGAVTLRAMRAAGAAAGDVLALLRSRHGASHEGAESRAG